MKVIMNASKDIEDLAEGIELYGLMVRQRRRITVYVYDRAMDRERQETRIINRNVGRMFGGKSCEWPIAIDCMTLGNGKLNLWMLGKDMPPIVADLND